MRTITADTLAYDLSVALRFGDLPPAIAAHLQGDLDRWDAQQSDPQAGIAVLKGWLQDRGYFVQMLSVADTMKRREMARNYVAFLRLYGATELNPERMLSKWEAEIARLSQAAPVARGGDGVGEGTEQSTHLLACVVTGL